MVPFLHTCSFTSTHWLQAFEVLQQKLPKSRLPDNKYELHCFHWDWEWEHYEHSIFTKTFATLGLQIWTPNIVVQSSNQETEKKYWTNSRHLYIYFYLFPPVELKMQKELSRTHSIRIFRKLWSTCRYHVSLKMGYTCQMNYSL